MQIYILNDKQCRSRSVGFLKTTDLDLHCFQRQGISGISRTRVNFLNNKCSFIFFLLAMMVCRLEKLKIKKGLTE